MNEGYRLWGAQPVFSNRLLSESVLEPVEIACGPQCKHDKPIGFMLVGEPFWTICFELKQIGWLSSRTWAATILPRNGE